jgi:hypothetical protein
MEDKKESMDKEVLEVLLVEYQAAQESAQHHDNLIWTVTTILWSATLVLFGFVLGSLDKPNLRPILIFLSILGIILTIAVWGFALQFNSVKRQKYNRCKTIERLLGMRQHRELKFSAGWQRIIYGIVTMLFIIVWVKVFVMVWNN